MLRREDCCAVVLGAVRFHLAEAESVVAPIDSIVDSSELMWTVEIVYHDAVSFWHLEGPWESYFEIPMVAASAPKRGIDEDSSRNGCHLLQTYIWDALHSGEGLASIVVMSQHFAPQSAIALQSIRDGLSMRLPNVSIQNRRDCVMYLSTNIDSMVRMPRKIPDMFIPATNQFS